MAVFTALQQFDYREFEVWIGTILTADPDVLFVERRDGPSEAVEYTGSFTYPAGVVGTITGFAYYVDGAVSYQMTGLNQDAEPYFVEINNLDTEGALNLLIKGDDLIIGSTEFDVIQGGAGNDTMRGGKAADNLEGNDGADLIFGQKGRDVLDGGLNADTLLGGIGDDFLLGGNGRDLLDGGDDNDTLNGNAGADELLGRQGADALFGGRQSDTLKGGQGADTLTGGKGLDVLTGGRGLDQFVMRTGERGDVVTDFAVGVDILVFEGITDAGQVQIISTAMGIQVEAGGMSVLLEGLSNATAEDLFGF